MKTFHLLVIFFCQMLPQHTCVVIKSGSHSTIAGFNNTDLPECILPSTYIKRERKNQATENTPQTSDPNEKPAYIFNKLEMLTLSSAPQDKRDSDDQLNVYTIIDERGVPYNWDALECQWRYIYEQCLQCDPSSLPLVITVPHMKDEVSVAVMEKYFDLVFNKFKVPVLQVVIEPLAVALSIGKTSALVVDMGSSGCSVTPIIDGTIVKSSVMRSKYGGDFLDYEIHKAVSRLLESEGRVGERLEGKKEKEGKPEEIDGSEVDAEGDLKMGDNDATSADTNTLSGIQQKATAPDSLQVWSESNTWMQDFKMTMLQVSDRDFLEIEKYYAEQTEMLIKQQEQLQQYVAADSQADGKPHNVSLDEATIASITNSNLLLQKRHYLYKPENKTLSFKIGECYRLGEYIFNPSLASEKFSKEDGLGELMVKAVRKAGGSISSVGTSILGSLGPTVATTSGRNNGPLGDNIFAGSGDSTIAATTTAGTSAPSTIGISTTPEQVYSSLLSNVIITGGTSMINGVEQRIIKELSTAFPQYKITTYMNQNLLDRKLQSWTGAVAMANLPSWELGKWYTKEDVLAKTARSTQRTGGSK